MDAGGVYNRVRRPTVRGTLEGHAGETDLVSRGDAGTTLPARLPAWLLWVKVLPVKAAAAFTQQIWCARGLPGGPGDKVRAAGGKGYFCGGSLGRRERGGRGGQAGGGHGSRAEATSLWPSGRWGDTEAVGLVSQGPSLLKEPAVMSTVSYTLHEDGQCFYFACNTGDGFRLCVTGAPTMNTSMKTPPCPPVPTRC